MSSLYLHNKERLKVKARLSSIDSPLATESAYLEISTHNMDINIFFNTTEEFTEFCSEHNFVFTDDRKHKVESEHSCDAL